MRTVVAGVFYLLASTLTTPALVLAAAPSATDWPAVLVEARGQSVAFNAWGGSQAVNAHIEWARQQVAARFDIALEHVKLTSTVDAVARIVAERAAGRDDRRQRSTSIWINGENFEALKRQDLLFGPFAFDLPNFALVDTVGKPTTLVDFTIPTEGYESPWGMAQFVFFHDTARVADAARLAGGAGRLDRGQSRPLHLPGTARLHRHHLPQAGPHRQRRRRGGARRTGRSGDGTGGDGTALGLAGAGDTPSLAPGPQLSGRRPGVAPAAGRRRDLALHELQSRGGVAADRGRAPAGQRAQLHLHGRHHRQHPFRGHPVQQPNRAAAMVVADFLLSPEAQARKQDPRLWGDPTVLDVVGLPPEDRARFEVLPLGVATLPPEALGPARPEPHPSWMLWLQAEWQRRIQG
jgi:putative thiamine transport system substrate-binding protein